MTPAFIFATGIENSYPTIQDGRVRVDEMAKCGHYEKWREDFACTAQLGIRFLRYGPPIHRTHLGAGRYDWTFADLTFADLRVRGITPIVDLCHFGVPDWMGDFQNPDFPALFAEYAGAFARRFPWVQLYTPVNEMYVCALVFGALWLVERAAPRTTGRSLRRSSTLVKANLLAMDSILAVRPDALFIQSESSEYFHAENPEAIQASGNL